MNETTETGAQAAADTAPGKEKKKRKTRKKRSSVKRKYFSFHTYPFSQKTSRLIRHEIEREEEAEKARQAEKKNAEDSDAKTPGESFGYLPLPFVHLCLPRSNSEEKEFVTKGRVFTMTIRTEDKLPWGAIPRLLIALFGLLASQNKSADFDLGNSIAGVLKQLNLDPLSSNNRTRFVEQWERVKKARFTITKTDTVKDADERPVRDKDGKTVKETVTVLDGPLFVEDTEAKTSKARPWHGKGTFTPEFHKLLTETTMPIKLSVLGELAQSTLDMDMYTWLPYRLFTLLGTRNAQIYFRYTLLRKHFNMDSLQLPLFKRRFLESLRNIFIFYPRAVDLCKDKGNGIVFKAGFPAIEFKTSKPAQPKPVRRKKKVKEVIIKKTPEHLIPFLEKNTKEKPRKKMTKPFKTK
jgi:hypothetical protein